MELPRPDPDQPGLPPLKLPVPNDNTAPTNINFGSLVQHKVQGAHVAWCVPEEIAQRD